MPNLFQKLSKKNSVRAKTRNKYEVFAFEEEFQPFIPRFTRALQRLFAIRGITGAEITLYLVGNAILPANVLSFPAQKNFPNPETHGIPLGEIFLNPAWICSHKENSLFMLIHGVLHLVGYDHKKTHDRIRMEREEKRLLRDPELCRILL